MLAAVLHDFNDLRLEEVPRPEPRGDQVLVRVNACGICATDFKAIKGIRRNVEFPAILGHEPSGIIAALGPGATHFREGDEVICSPSGYCGYCKQCRVGNTHYCEHVFTTGGDGAPEVWPGAFAEYFLVRENMLYHKPEGVSFEAAAITEPLSGAWKGLIHYSQLQVGEDVVIIGAGGIGMLCVMVAHAAGAGRLVVVDPSAWSRENALKVGATHVVDPTAGDPYKAVYDILPDGPDLVLEAAGPIQAVELMVKLRRRGTRWNIFGITTHETFSLDGGYTHFLEGRMDSSFSTTPLAMQRAIRLIEAGLVNPEKIISHRFPLSQIARAIEVMASPQRNKVVINP